jgi:hypothetical protein
MSTLAKNTGWCNLIFLICIVGGGVQTGPTRQVGHSLAYCTCPGWLWGWRIWWNEWQGKPKYSEKICPEATLSTTNPTWPDPGLKPGHRGGKPATNRFSYDSAAGWCNSRCYKYVITIIYMSIVVHVLKNSLLRVCYRNNGQFVVLCNRYRIQELSSSYMAPIN